MPDRSQSPFDRFCPMAHPPGGDWIARSKLFDDLRKCAEPCRALDLRVMALIVDRPLCFNTADMLDGSEVRTFPPGVDAETTQRLYKVQPAFSQRVPFFTEKPQDTLSLLRSLCYFGFGNGFREGDFPEYAAPFRVTDGRDYAFEDE